MSKFTEQDSHISSLTKTLLRKKHVSINHIADAYASVNDIENATVQVAERPAYHLIWYRGR